MQHQHSPPPSPGWRTLLLPESRPWSSLGCGWAVRVGAERTSVGCRGGRGLGTDHEDRELAAGSPPLVHRELRKCRGHSHPKLTASQRLRLLQADVSRLVACASSFCAARTVQKEDLVGQAARASLRPIPPATDFASRGGRGGHGACAVSARGLRTWASIMGSTGTAVAQPRTPSVSKPHHTMHAGWIRARQGDAGLAWLQATHTCAGACMGTRARACMQAASTQGSSRRA